MSEHCRAGGISGEHDRFKDTNTCRLCGENMPQPISDLVELQRQITLKYGVQISDHDIGYYIDSDDLGEILALVEPVIRAKVNEESNDDAKRYQFLRNADIDSVQKGGIFAGVTPENIVLNGDDLDEAIDAAIKESV